MKHNLEVADAFAEVVKRLWKGQSTLDCEVLSTPDIP